MASTGLRRGLVTAALFAAAAGLPGVAHADPPKFNVDGYTTCTATTAPTPDQDYDGMVSACCVQNAGVPTSTKYGMACVAATENQSADFRPTIVLPYRPQPQDDAGLLLGDLDDTNSPPLPDGPNVVGNPFDEAGSP
jgi:hypothetical protein